MTDIVELDVLIVGAGVIGAAVARSAADRRLGRIAVLEKEAEPARHTSGRNSGVIHAGFNGKPGTLKARFCVEGNRRLRAFCRERGLPMQEGGTVVAAQSESEEEVLHELLRRGRENGVEGIEMVDRAGLLRREPRANGRSALYAPTGAIASGRKVVTALVAEAQEKGCRFHYGCRVRRIEKTADGFTVDAGNLRFRTRVLINCAGLYADRIAGMLDLARNYTIVPFRGEYHRLRPGHGRLLNSMLYPVPDLAFPFLGVHWTTTVDGDTLIGPSSTLAWSRESYSAGSFDPSETVAMAADSRFWKMLVRREMRELIARQLRMSLSRSRFVAEARKLIPTVGENDFEPYKAGNRAQLIDAGGTLVDDMLVLKESGSIHVLNAVSPGFTCSLPFADHIVGMI